MSLKKSIKIASNTTIEEIKNKIYQLFGITNEEQILLYNNRTINLNHKRANEIGLKEGGLIVLRRQTKIQGGKKENGMQEIFKNPFMKIMLKNPNTIKSIKKMFENESNENLNMILNNDGMEDEIEKLTQDNDYLNNQMRNVDLAMAKLENMPGGMNIMSSMLKDTQDPLKKMITEIKYKPGNKIDQITTNKIPGQIKLNPLIQFRKENALLIEKGFSNINDNIDALVKSNGDILNAIQLLIMKYDK